MLFIRNTEEKETIINLDKVFFVMAIVLALVSISCMCFLWWFAFAFEGSANPYLESSAPTESTTETTTETTILPVTEPSIETIPETTQQPTETPTTEPPEPSSEPVSEPETTETVSEVDEDDLELLACAIYTEVGGSCDDCLRYCGDVILNRVADSRFPNTIHKVLTAPNQYAAFGNGVHWPSRANNTYEAEYVERAYRIARELLEGGHSELYGNGYVWQAQFVQGSSGFWCCGEYYGKS